MTAEGIQQMCQDFVAVAGGPYGLHDTREIWLARAARNLGIETRRAKAFWYREVRRIPADEFLALQDKAIRLAQRSEDRDKDVAAIRARIAALREAS